MAALIADRKAAGAALIVVEQNLAFAERIADRYLVMDQGRVVLTGARADIDRASCWPISTCEPLLCGLFSHLIHDPSQPACGNTEFGIGSRERQLRIIF